MNRNYLELVFRKAAYDQNMDFDDFSESEIAEFIDKIMEKEIPKLAEVLGVETEEVMKLNKEEQYELVATYMLNYEAAI